MERLKRLGGNNGGSVWFFSAEIIHLCANTLLKHKISGLNIISQDQVQRREGHCPAESSQVYHHIQSLKTALEANSV